MNPPEHLSLCLIEECNEVGQAMSKLLRFGPTDRYPNAEKPTTTEKLIFELNDLYATVELLVGAKILPADWQRDNLKAAKKDKILRYMEYARATGTLVGPSSYEEWLRRVNA
jgi:hypothetical protein